MERQKWEKWAGLGSIWFVVLVAIAASEQYPLPLRDATVAEVFAYVQANQDVLPLSAWLGSLATLGMIAWFGSLWVAMERTGKATGLNVIALVGLSFGMVSGLAFNALIGTAAADVDSLTGDVAMLFEIAGLFHVLARLGDVMLLAAVVTLTLTTNFLPRWTAYLGIGAALAAFATSATVLSEGVGFSYVGAAWALTYGAWVIAVGRALYQGYGYEGELATS